MSSFHAHVLSCLTAILDPPKPGGGGASEWAPSSVSVRVLGRSPTYLASRLSGRPTDPPILVRDASAILAAKRLGAGALLDLDGYLDNDTGVACDPLDGYATEGGCDDSDAYPSAEGVCADAYPSAEGVCADTDIAATPAMSFLDIVYGRLLGLVSVAGLTTRDLQAKPAVSCNTSRASWEGRQKLTCDEVDSVLAHLGLPLGAMFAPALGPYDAALLDVLATRQDATGARATRAEVEAILSGYRGATRASRPTGSKAGGAQLATTGCAGAIRRMLDQDLLEVAERGTRPSHDVLVVTAAGRRVAASRPVTVTVTPNPGT